MRTRWSPSALYSLDLCARRFALREEGWTPRPDPLRPSAPHAEFGRVWHAAAERYDTALFAGAGPDAATEIAFEYALAATWDVEGGPLGGTSMWEWRCAPGGTRFLSAKTGKPIQCPASKGWWVDAAQARAECPKCGGEIERRHAFEPHRSAKGIATVKTRPNLLRAVLDYCDEALPGVALDADGAGPALEMELEFSLAGISLHCILDRYTELGSTMRVAHERKSSSVAPHPWEKYLQTYQVRFYPEALRQNGLRCDGVLMEHYQIMQGGTQRSTATLTPGPDHIAEAAERTVELVNTAEAYDGRDALDWPSRFSACAHAAGGRQCEFLKVCKAAQARRPELLRAEFVQEVRG